LNHTESINLNEDENEEVKNNEIHNSENGFVYNLAKTKINISLPVKTESTTKNFLNKKRNEEKIDFDEKDENLDLKNNDNYKYNSNKKNEALEKVKTESDFEVKPRGRRKKDDTFDNNAKHNKFDSDNIMKKIKTFLSIFILVLLNDNLINKNYKFNPLNSKINTNLKKDFNIKLLNTTIYEIFTNPEFNKKDKKGENPNEKLIARIYEEKIETKIIDILSLTYKDIINIIRKNDLHNFMERIREKEERNNKYKNENFDLYMTKVENLLYDYENYFNQKIGRFVGSKKKSKNRLGK